MGKKEETLGIEFKKVILTDDCRAKLQKSERNNFDKMLNEAKEELLFYDWCKDILESYVGMFYEGIVGVFLFKIVPSSKKIDHWLWLVVGDLPRLYITCEDAPNAACALQGYIGAMRDWVYAVKNNKPLDDLVPVEVPATKENAHRLDKRLNFLEQKILSFYEKDLKA